MKSKLIFILLLFSSVYLSAQKADTLTFYSAAFKTERSIYVITPQFYKYQTPEVKLPVIYILDGQHDWFVNPVINSIHYLQYTHQVPQALVIVIPLMDRNKECGIKTLTGEKLPLHRFITEEIDEKIQQYRPGKGKVLIGHSFSASFALYSYLQNPGYYSAVIANTPLNSFKEMIQAFWEKKEIDKSRIFISVGGRARHEDFYHRKAFDTLVREFPLFFNAVNTFIAEHAVHNAVPILATPNFLTKLFSRFTERYADIALVDNEYKLISKPKAIRDELMKIDAASKIFDFFYPPEIAELNGIASRYWNSDLTDYVIAVYEMALKYYPDYYDFHLQLYELLSPIEKKRAQYHLSRARALLVSLEGELPEKETLIKSIDDQQKSNGVQGKSE